MVVGGDDEGVVVVVVVTLTGCTFWRLRTHRVPGVRKLFNHGQNALPDGVAGHGGQVPAAELALLGLPAAQAAKLELQGMQQVFRFGACARRTGWGQNAAQASGRISS